MKKIFYIMSSSISKWFSYFCSEKNYKEIVVRNLPLDNKVSEEITRIECLYGKEVEIYILSSHISLNRDICLARLLIKKGYVVYAQSDMATDYGINKVYQKEMFEVNKYLTPQWTVSHKNINNDYLIKKNNATEAKGVTWYNNKTSHRRDIYFEKYISGTEYSVNVFSDKMQSLAFPAVYKGVNSKELVPPYMRIRLCGKYNNQVEIYVNKMQNIALELSKEINNYGFMEVEFLVDKEGNIYILEINPRVSGTLRIATLAAGVKCFDLYFYSKMQKSKLVARHNAYEIPYDGSTLFNNDAGIYCTSRATFLASTNNEIEDKLRLIGEQKITLTDIINRKNEVLDIQ